jgi:hypothetical protein
LKTPYPPKYNWIVESQAIDNLWQNHIEKGRQHDPRLKRYPIFMHDPTKLQHDVDSNTSVLVYDKINKKQLVMVIIRNFVDHPGLLSYMEDIIKANVEHRKHMRVRMISKSCILSYSLQFF